MQTVTAQIKNNCGETYEARNGKSLIAPGSALKEWKCFIRTSFCIQKTTSSFSPPEKIKMILPSQDPLEVSFRSSAGCLGFLEELSCKTPQRHIPKERGLSLWGLLLLIFSLNLPSVLKHAGIDSNRTNGSVMLRLMKLSYQFVVFWLQPDGCCVQEPAEVALWAADRKGQAGSLSECSYYFAISKCGQNWLQSIFCIYSVKEAWSLAELNESVLMLTAFLC